MVISPGVSLAREARPACLLLEGVGGGGVYFPGLHGDSCPPERGLKRGTRASVRPDRVDEGGVKCDRCWFGSGVEGAREEVIGSCGA